MVDAGGEIGGNAVLGEVAEFVPECVDQIGHPLTECEQLFELVEDDQWCQRIVPCTPQLEILVMQVLP